MSASNVERLAQAFAGWGKGNPANMRDVSTPTASWWSRIRLRTAAPSAERRVIRWFTRELWRWLDEFTSTPESFIDCGDRIVVPVRVQPRAKNGKTMDVHNVWIYEFSEGKLTRGRVYADTAVLRDTVEGITSA